jgi:hypothetical protein
VTQSIASSFEFTWNIQNPAINSLSSGNGPSVTVSLPRENLMRVPFELGCRPSPASSTDPQPAARRAYGEQLAGLVDGEPMTPHQILGMALRQPFEEPAVLIE